MSEASSPDQSQTQICPDCGHVNVIGQSACEQCGARLESVKTPPGHTVRVDRNAARRKKVVQILIGYLIISAVYGSAIWATTDGIDEFFLLLAFAKAGAAFSLGTKVLWGRELTMLILGVGLVLRIVDIISMSELNISVVIVAVSFISLATDAFFLLWLNAHKYLYLD